MNTAFKMFDDSAFAEMARVAQSIERINTAHKFDDDTSAKLALAARSMERISTQIGETIPKDFSKRLSSHLQGIDFKNTIQWPEGMFDQIANSLSIPNPPALTSLSDSLADTAERMRRSLATPTLVRSEPLIIEPSSEDIQAVGQCLPLRPKRKTRFVRLHERFFERAKEIYSGGLLVGPYEIAIQIVFECNGAAHTLNLAMAKTDKCPNGKPYGTSDDAAHRALALQIKNWIAGGWTDPR